MSRIEIALIVAAVVVVGYLIYQAENADSSPADSSDGSPDSDSTQTGVSSILSALAGFENVNPSHNNPGGMCDLTTMVGGVCSGPATYDTLDEGTAAADNLIQSKLNAHPTWTVAQFVQNWAFGTGQVPASGQQTLQNYIARVSAALGLSANEPISDAIQ